MMTASSINTSLTVLTKLTSLQLGSNGLIGTIPSSLTLLSSLEVCRGSTTVHGAWCMLWSVLRLRRARLGLAHALHVYAHTSGAGAGLQHAHGQPAR